MNKLRLLCLATLCMTGASLASPVTSIGEIVNNPVLLPISDSVAAISEKQSVDNNNLLVESSGMSDETWLLFAAMLALAGIVIVHRTSH